MSDCPRASRSLCIGCNHMSIWHVEFENRICQLSQLPPDLVLAGGVTTCANFLGRRFIEAAPKNPVPQRGNKPVSIAKPTSEPIPQPSKPVKMRKPWR